MKFLHFSFSYCFQFKVGQCTTEFYSNWHWIVFTRETYFPIPLPAFVSSQCVWFLHSLRWWLCNLKMLMFRLDPTCFDSARPIFDVNNLKQIDLLLRKQFNQKSCVGYLLRINKLRNNKLFIWELTLITNFKINFKIILWTSGVAYEKQSRGF